MVVTASSSIVGEDAFSLGSLAPPLACALIAYRTVGGATYFWDTPPLAFFFGGFLRSGWICPGVFASLRKILQPQRHGALPDDVTIVTDVRKEKWEHEYCCTDASLCIVHRSKVGLPFIYPALCRYEAGGLPCDIRLPVIQPQSPTKARLN
jgi:hypothetical protein